MDRWDDLFYRMGLYTSALDFWAQMYVDGIWTLEKLEAHADAIRQGMFGR